MNKPGWFACFMVVALLGAGVPAAAETRLFVANFGGDVSVIDVASNELVDTITVGGVVDDVEPSPDGRTLYVNVWITEDHRYLPNYGELVAISTATHEVLWRMPLRDGWPHHISVSPDGRHLYSPVFDRTYVNVIDLEERRVVRRIDGHLGMHGTKLSADGDRLYIGAMTAEALIVVETATGDILQYLDFVGGVRPFAVPKDESVVYAQLSRLHGFVVADLKSGALLQKVEFPRPDAIELPAAWPHTYDHGIALTADERLLLAAGSLQNMLAIYAVPEVEHVATVPICQDPNWVVATADSKTAYVSCQGSNQVSVVDLVAKREVKRVPTGSEQPVRMRLVDVPEPYQP